MHIETRGHGPALGLIHGWAMHGGLFAPLVERLADRYTLHLVDLPGHGHAHADTIPLSPKAIAAELVWRVPDAVWLGWSLGGQFALRAALDHPERVRGAVMLASSPRFVSGDGWAHGVDPQVFRDFASLLQQDFRGTLEGFLALEALGSTHVQDDLRSLKSQAFARGEPAQWALLEGLRLLDVFDVRAELPGLQVPSLWIGGRRDRLVPAAAMPAAAASAPNARSVVLANAGHAPFLSAADAVAGEIDAFLRGLEAGRAVAAPAVARRTADERAVDERAGAERAVDVRAVEVHAVEVRAGEVRAVEERAVGAHAGQDRADPQARRAPPALRIVAPPCPTPAPPAHAAGPGADAPAPDVPRSPYRPRPPEPGA